MKRIARKTKKTETGKSPLGICTDMGWMWNLYIHREMMSKGSEAALGVVSGEAWSVAGFSEVSGEGVGFPSVTSINWLRSEPQTGHFSGGSFPVCT